MMQIMGHLYEKLLERAWDHREIDHREIDRVLTKSWPDTIILGQFVEKLQERILEL